MVQVMGAASYADTSSDLGVSLQPKLEFIHGYSDYSLISLLAKNLVSD